MDRYLDGQSFLKNIPNFRASEHPSIPDFPYETETSFLCVNKFPEWPASSMDATCKLLGVSQN